MQADLGEGVEDLVVITELHNHLNFKLLMNKLDQCRPTWRRRGRAL